jgi:hypothetical protein
VAGAFPIGALAGGAIAWVAGLRAPFAFGAALTLVLVPFLCSALAGVELDPTAVGPDPAVG